MLRLETRKDTQVVLRLNPKRTTGFTDDEVRTIRKEYTPAKIIEMALHYQTSQDTIRCIAKRRTYKGVKDEQVS